MARHPAADLAVEVGIGLPSPQAGSPTGGIRERIRVDASPPPQSALGCRACAGIAASAAGPSSPPSAPSPSRGRAPRSPCRGGARRLRGPPPPTPPAASTGCMRWSSSTGARPSSPRPSAGRRSTRPVNVKSVAKSVVAALTGAALDRGELPGLDATLGEVAPRLIPPAADPRVARISLADLVTMQAGLERTSGPAYGGWVSSPNWVADALSRPMVGEPGRGMLYSTGSVHVLGAVLATVSGESLLAQARAADRRPARHRDPGLDPRPAGLLPRRQRDGARARSPWRASASSTAGAAAPARRRS